MNFHLISSLNQLWWKKRWWDCCVRQLSVRPRFIAISGLWEFTPASHEYEIFLPLSTWSSMRFNTFIRLLWLFIPRRSWWKNEKFSWGFESLCAKINSKSLPWHNRVSDVLGNLNKFSFLNSKRLKIKWEPFQTFNLFIRYVITIRERFPLNQQKVASRVVERLYRSWLTVPLRFLRKTKLETFRSLPHKRNFSTCNMNVLTCGIFYVFSFLIQEKTFDFLGNKQKLNNENLLKFLVTLFKYLLARQSTRIHLKAVVLLTTKHFSFYAINYNFFHRISEHMTKTIFLTIIILRLIVLRTLFFYLKVSHVLVEFLLISEKFRQLFTKQHLPVSEGICNAWKFTLPRFSLLSLKGLCCCLRCFSLSEMSWKGKNLLLINPQTMFSY